MCTKWNTECRAIVLVVSSLPVHQDQYFFIYEAVAEVIVCGDTEVPLEQLGDYVNDIVTVAADQTDTTDHSNIELQFKVRACREQCTAHYIDLGHYRHSVECLDHSLALTSFPAETGSGQN